MYSKKEAILSRIWKGSTDTSFNAQSDDAIALQSENASPMSCIRKQWEISYKAVSYKRNRPLKRNLYQQLAQYRAQSPLFTFKSAEVMNYSSYHHQNSYTLNLSYVRPVPQKQESHQRQHIHNASSLQHSHSNELNHRRYHLDAPVRKITLRRFHSQLAIASSTSSTSLSTTARKHPTIILQNRSREREREREREDKKSKMKQNSNSINFIHTEIDKLTASSNQNRPKQQQRLQNIRKELNQIYLNRNRNQNKLKIL